MDFLGIRRPPFKVILQYLILERAPCVIEWLCSIICSSQCGIDSAGAEREWKEDDEPDEAKEAVNVPIHENHSEIKLFGLTAAFFYISGFQLEERVSQGVRETSQRVQEIQILFNIKKLLVGICLYLGVRWHKKVWEPLFNIQFYFLQK